MSALAFVGYNSTNQLVIVRTVILLFNYIHVSLSLCRTN